MDRQNKEQERPGENAGKQENATKPQQENVQNSDTRNMDRHEGQMDNGELGGNFEEAQEAGTSEQPQ